MMGPQLIWQEMTADPFPSRPPGRPLTVASYEAGDELRAYVEPFAVTDAIPDAPLFLEPGYYVEVPLEATYQRSWAVMPAILRETIEHPDG